MICPRDDEVFYGRAFRLLGEEERRLLDAHMLGCPRCKRTAGTIERTLAVGDVDASPGLADRIFERIHSVARWRKRAYVLSFSGLLLIGCAVIWLLYQLAQNKAEHRFVRDLEHQIQAYRNQHGSYPPDDQPLSRFIELPKARLDYHGHVLDRWGTPIRYTAPGRHNPALFDLQSLGRNGRDNSGDGDDITNW